MEQKQELESTHGYKRRKLNIHLGKEGEGDKIETHSSETQNSAR